MNAQRKKTATRAVFFIQQQEHKLRCCEGLPLRQHSATGASCERKLELEVRTDGQTTKVVVVQIRIKLWCQSVTCAADKVDAA